MAASRASIKSLSGHLVRDTSVLRGLARCLSSFSVSSNSVAASGSSSILYCSSGNGFDRSGSRNLQPALLGKRNLKTSVQDSQQSQLQADIAASDPAPGLHSIPLPLRNYSPSLSRFSALPNPAAAELPLGLGSSSDVKTFTLEQLGREMSNCLSHGKLDETVRLFENWVTSADVQGKVKVPNMMAYNLLLHAKLRLGVDPRSMLQVVKDMEMHGLTPNLLSYNFILRAVFRQRDSVMAEKILKMMEESGPEGQPDGDSYNFVIVLCAMDRRLDEAMKHLDSMLARGYVPSKTTYNELLFGAAKARRSRVAVDLMKDLKKRNVLPQEQTIIELALSAAEVDDAECAVLALGFLASPELQKSQRSIVIDEGGIHYLLSTAARTASTSLSNEAWSILHNSLRESRPPSPAVYLARIHSLATTGDLDTAFSTLRELETAYGNPKIDVDREILSPFSSLRPLVLACTRGGFVTLDSAYYKLAEIQASGVPVALSAINCVIQGCANIWDFDRAYQTFETIGSTFGLMPNVHSCNSLLDVFGKNRKTPEVLQIFSYMHDVGVIPDDRSYELLVDAHCVNRDPKAAMGALDAMTSAGHFPQRETLLKIWRRCTKENDTEGSNQILHLIRKLGYRDTLQDVAKWERIP